MQLPPAAPRKLRIPPALLRLAGVGVVLYVGLAAFVYFQQATLIFPGSITQGRPSAEVTPPPGAELVTLATRPHRIVGLFAPALTEEGRPHPDAARRPTLLYFYGNGMCLADAAGELNLFRRLGMNVLIPEYPGFGLSGGRPSEVGCYAAADAADAHLRARPDVDPEQIVAGGWSLGAAVAIDLAARRHVAGVATFSAFTSMAELARSRFPWLPVGLLLRHRFESERKIARVRCPILIGHGRDDTLIPAAMADRLAAAAGGPVIRVNVADGDHNDFFAVGAEQVERGMRELMRRL